MGNIIIENSYTLYSHPLCRNRKRGNEEAVEFREYVVEEIGIVR